MPLPTEWFHPSAMLTKYCPDAIAPPLIMRIGPNKLNWRRHTVVHLPFWHKFNLFLLFCRTFGELFIIYANPLSL